MTRKHLLTALLSLLLFLAVVTVSFAAGYSVGYTGTPVRPLAQVLSGVFPEVTARMVPAAIDDQIGIIRQVWELVNKEFYQQPVDQAALLRGAIRGMLETLNDPHTVYLDPETSQQQREHTNQAFEGIGATIGQRDEFVEIQSVFPDSPAERGGLQAGDLILAVDGADVQGKSPAEVARLVRGPAGTRVVLTVRRGDAAPFEIVLIRAKVIVPSVSSALLEGPVGYIRLWQFGAHTTDELRRALTSLREQGVQGLVLDLRGNAGGLLQSAVEVSSEFLPAGSVILYEEQAQHPPTAYRAQRRGLARDLPLIVLVDGRSASAAEIVAGALVDHNRAVLIGERTYGKGTVQLPHDLADGSQVRITIARWLTPNHQSIAGQGIVPTIEIAAPIAPTPQGDAAVRRALQELAQWQAERRAS